MPEAPQTRPSLLVRIRDAEDDEAWGQFVEIYAPLVYGFLRKHGLQDADAGDLTQETLRAVARAAGDLEYDPERGTFRAWLFTIVRNKLRNFLASPKRRERGAGDSDVQQRLAEIPNPDDGSEWWDQEYERRIFRWAAEQVRTEVQPKTWQAFWMTAVEGKPVKAVPKELGLTVASVYLAKSRVTARLKEHVQQLQLE
jgi:RNA polymerase sigma-70 factor (ECF subfamily)